VQILEFEVFGPAATSVVNDLNKTVEFQHGRPRRP